MIIRELSKKNLLKAASMARDIVKDNTVYVIGPKDTNIDTYVSIIATVNLLKHLNINAKPVLTNEKMNEYTTEYISSFNHKKIPRESIEEGSFLFLVNHNNIAHSGQAVSYDNVIGVIDNHIDECPNVPMKIIKKKGSTASILSTLHYTMGINTDKKLNEMLLKAIAITTYNFCSSKTTTADKTCAKGICSQLGIDFSDLKEKIVIKDTDISMNNEKYALNHLKKYSLGGRKILSSYIDISERDLSFEKRLPNLLKVIKNKNQDIFLFLIRELSTKKTYVYTLDKNKDCLESKVLNYIASRDRTIIPRIKNQLV